MPINDDDEFTPAKTEKLLRDAPAFAARNQATWDEQYAAHKNLPSLVLDEDNEWLFAERLGGRLQMLLSAGVGLTKSGVNTPQMRWTSRIAQSSPTS
jgi:hypothetical protein